MSLLTIALQLGAMGNEMKRNVPAVLAAVLLVSLSPVGADAAGKKDTSQKDLEDACAAVNAACNAGCGAVKDLKDQLVCFAKCNNANDTCLGKALTVQHQKQQAPKHGAIGN